MIRARMFEYLAIRNDIDQANTQLDRLTSDMTELESPVDIHYLTYHLNNCLKNDKIDGIGYLTNYFERYQVDCSGMPLNRFHPMLDYYLNHNFDLSKVLIFCKFYRQYYANSIRNGLEQVLTEGQKPGTMDEAQLKALNYLVFAKNDSLIDMRTLAKFLVRKTGDRQIIDPKTGEDTFWALIQMFTQSADVYQASSQAKNNHIEPETVAEFLGNRLAYPDSIDRVMKVAARLGDTKVGRQFSAKMLEQVKAFQTSHNGELPQSFTKAALKDLYVKLLPQRDTIASNTSELLLYLLQSKGLHAEVVNYCDKLPKNDLSRYYMTESLLHLPLKQGTYLGALQKSNLFESQEQSAMYLTQHTKAVMLDKGPEAAYAYFQEHYEKIEERANQQKTLLISLYDMLMGSGEKLEFQEFKDRYQNSSLLASRLAKESFVVNQMEKLLKDKDYDQVEAAFNLYAVMREERLLEKAEFLMNEQNLSEVTKISAVTEQQMQQLQDVRARRQELEKQVGLNDAEICASIASVLQDDFITVFDKADAEQIKKVASIFKDITEEEAASIESTSREIAATILDEDSVISDLESLGFEREKLIQFYELLDYGTSEEGQNLSERRQQQRAKYEKLSSEDKELFQKVQEAFANNMEELVRAKFTVKDALAVIRKFETEHAQGLADMYYQSDYSHSEGSDPELIEAEQTLFKEEYEREKRHQEQYIDKLEEQFPTINIQRILGKQSGSEDTESEQDEKDSDKKTDNESDEENDEDEENEEVDEVSEIEEVEKVKEVQEIEEVNESEDSEEAAEIAEGHEFISAELRNQIEKVRKVNKANEEKILAKISSELDEALINAGLADKHGQLDPVLKAALVQTLINIAEDTTYQNYKSGTQEDFELDEDLEENWLDPAIEEELQDKVNEEALKYRADTKFAHPISDLSDLEDQNDPSAVMADFWQTIDANTEFYIKDRVKELVTPKINRDYVKERIRKGYRTRWLYERMERNQLMLSNPKNFLGRLRNAKKMDKFRKKMLESPLGPRDMESDPKALEKQIHDATVFTLKEKLLFAINKRKYEALPVAIQIFNQIQNKQLGDRFRLEDFEQKNVKDFSILDKNTRQEISEVQVKDIGQTLQKLDLLLNDSRSPIISTLVDTSKYKQNRLPEEADEYYQGSAGYTRETLDITAYERDLEKLSILQDQVERIEKTVELINKKVVDGIKNVDGQLNEQVLAHKRREMKELQTKNHQRIRKIYNSFNYNSQQQEKINEHKVRVMRDVLALELGDSFNVNFESDKTASQFPAFYAFDLISFGIKRKQPAAVRLGEKLLAESCPSEQAKIPRELAMSIKNFMLDYDNNMQYRDAMKLTGPISNSRLYHMSNQQSAAQGITYCMDDPYWQEFTLKNRRREDQWRNPSIFAYRYKQYGMLGELVDMHAVQKKYDMAFSRPM